MKSGSSFRCFTSLLFATLFLVPVGCQKTVEHDPETPSGQSPKNEQASKSTQNEHPANSETSNSSLKTHQQETSEKKDPDRFAEGFAPNGDVQEEWAEVVTGNQKIGYTRSSLQTGTRESKQTVRLYTSDSRWEISRFNQKMRLQHRIRTLETESGEILEYEFVQKNPPTNETTTRGIVQGDQLYLTNTINGKVSHQQKKWDSTQKSPFTQDQFFKEWKKKHGTLPKPGTLTKLPLFMIDTGSPAELSCMMQDLETVTMRDGSTRKLHRSDWIIDHKSLFAPKIKVTSWLDDEGAILKSSMDLLGRTIDTYVVTREEALKSSGTATFDLAVDGLIKVKPIRNPHRTKKITYRLKLKENADSTFEFFKIGAEERNSNQVVKTIDDQTVELTVQAVPLPESATLKPSEAEYLVSTPFLQVDDPLVIQHANSAIQETSDPAQMVKLMEGYVHRVINKKNFSTAMASAGEVAKTLSGDCTEHAVLLAAMLRAKKIPSRVVAGLVYVPQLSSFGGHMWTEAFLNDRWVPLDATLGQGGTGAAHIKLLASSMKDQGTTPASVFLPIISILGNLDIDVLHIE